MIPLRPLHAALPAPEPEAARHSLRLSAALRQEIEAGGPMSFARYMERVLYAPGLGYYSAGAAKFGEPGDFITAPELSPLFSRLLARQCAEVLESLGGGEILELGAGSGRMAAEVLAELERLGRLPERYRILELSADLRVRQQRTLGARVPRLLSRVEWLERMPAEPFAGVVLGNELLDAMPVHRFRIVADGVRELGVSVSGESFAWSELPASPELLAAAESLRAALPAPLPAGYTSEINLNLEPWFRALAGSLARGVVLLIDYGYPRHEYYLPERRDGTLVCHYRLRAHDDPFFLPGLQDISAFVDFSAAARAAEAAGFSLAGYTSQANFLLGCGLEHLLAESGPEEGVAHLRRMQEVKRLMLPGEMGERFKVLALGRGYAAPLCGFSARDLRGRL